MRYATGAGAGDMADINIIPLADVLLVLLIVFMVSAPAVTDTIGLTLPQPGPDRVDPPPPPREIVLRVDAAGDTYWDGALMTDAALVNALSAVAARASTVDAQPKVLVEANDAADYQSVARVLAAAGNAGLQKVAFAHD